MNELNVVDYFSAISLDQEEKLIERLNIILALKKRNKEIIKRLDSEHKDRKCKECEYGKYRPCGYTAWRFELSGDDPACEHFQEWGQVW